MNNKLAIVIPAYKSTYFEKTMQSIANQTNKNFVLYIGNDGEDKDIKSIVSKYASELKIVYKEFEYNLGRESLIKQWDRCVEMVVNEEYVWFFSDDDIMAAECVDSFYKNLLYTKELFDVYRFNTIVIDPLDQIVFKNPEHPVIETANEFAHMRFAEERLSTACEYIFKNDTFKRKGGFIDFPKAWCSDDATWINFSSDTGINTIQGPKVSWRTSTQSISGSIDGKEQKILALKKYLNWYNSQSFLAFDNSVLNKQKFWMYKHYFKYLYKTNVFEWFSLIKYLSKLHKDGFMFNVFFLFKFIKNNRHFINKH